MSNSINTIEDLFSYLDADYYPDDKERSNNSLSRRVYKDTSCGAWARYVGPGKMETSTTKERWSCEFQKDSVGKWSVRAFISPAGDRMADSEAPSAVLSYFMPVGYEQGTYDFLNENYPNEDFVVLSETLIVPQYGMHSGIFIVGSIVEGVDATTDVHEVYLPCPESAIDNAVQAVEDEASYIWQQTHGCDACGIEGEWGLPAINSDCKECNGEGCII